MQHSEETNAVPYAFWREPLQDDLEDLHLSFVTNGVTMKALFSSSSGKESGINGFDCTAKLAAGVHEALLYFNSKNADVLLAKLVPGAFLKRDGGDRDLVFLNHLATPALNALENLGLGAASITSIIFAPVETSDFDRFEVINFQDGAGKIHGLAGIAGTADFFAALKLALLASLAEKAKLNSAAKTLRSDVSLLAGIVSLSLYDLKRLKVGQGIFLDIAPIEENALYVSLGQEQYLSARIVGHSAQITNEAFLKMPNDAENMNNFADFGSVQPFPGTAPGVNQQNQMGGFQPNPQLQNSLVAVDDLPIQVTVEIARYELTIDEISSLRAGSMFEIPENPKKFVTLRVGHQILGHGEIVQAGHKLAVRITEMKP